VNILSSKKLLLVLAVFLYAVAHFASVLYLDNAAEYTMLPPAPVDDLLIPQESMTVLGDPDGIAWVMYAQEAETKGLWRTPRYTYSDNYPYGRFVGWHSINTQWLRLLGHIRSWVTGEDILPAIARAAAYSNAAYLLLFSVPIGFMAVRLLSLRGAFLYPIFIQLVYNPRMGFRSPDHHLLSVVFFLLLVLALLLLAKEEKRRWLILSGLMLGVLFWISALSAVIITLGLVVGFPFLGNLGRMPRLSDLLMMNGTATVVISLTYVFEFFPDFQTHLEVVHPIYGICLLIAAFIIHQWCRFYYSGFDLKSLDVRMLLYPGLVFVGIGLLVIYNLNDWYTPSDLFLKRWMQLISESQSLDLKGFFVGPNWIAILFVLSVISGLQFAENWRPQPRGILLFNLALGGVILLFCVNQQRIVDFIWVPISVLLTMLCFFCKRRAVGTALSIIVGLLVVSSFISRFSSANSCRRSGEMDMLGSHLVYSYNLRIRAQELLGVSPDSDMSLLVSSNWSIYMNYYTHKPVYGSFYWENYDGNLRAFHMLYRRKDSDTGEFPLIREFLSNSQVDEILVGKNELSLQMSYAVFGEEGRIRQKENAFIGYLEQVEEEDLPDWLILKLDNDHMRLFEVVPVAKEKLDEALSSGA